jgi:hypothetical protein
LSALISSRAFSSFHAQTDKTKAIDVPVGGRNGDAATPPPACLRASQRSRKSLFPSHAAKCGARRALSSRTNLNPTFCIYPSFRKKVDFAGFSCRVRAVRDERGVATAKEKAKADGEEISRLCAFAYILPGLLSDLEAD